MEYLTRATFDVKKYEIERSEGAPAPRIVGYAAVFSTPTDLGPFSEEIAPGAFAESISRGDDVRALFNHDPSAILGRTRAGTLSLGEDPTGLVARITPPDTQLGRDVVALIERGDISQMSFGFYVEDEESEKRNGKPHFTITRARLFDVSPVTFPAYESTSVSLERHARDLTARIARLEERENRAAAERARRSRMIRRLRSTY